MNSTKYYQVDEAFIRRAAAMVVERLRSMTAPDANTLPHKVVSEQHILDTHPGTRLVVRHDALVTPLAKDTANDRSVQIIRSSEPKT